ncbi:Growth factor receptor-bound protein 10 [Liparis tanakae]|uniref:Growth factor receptor-bound protein 10 n=1 Tax=Liparis tanakae TaxID=230148 RepID=A0A4Z2GP16_9TELE|nr:Growth factor receptor-bound protein 10 [Liparis tanakae]
MQTNETRPTRNEDVFTTRPRDAMEENNGTSYHRLVFTSTTERPEDDVDLEQLVNEMNSSMESVYSTQADTALLLTNGHAPAHHHAAQRRQTPPLSSTSRERLRHSQPMHIRAVRCLQEEHLLRPASLPAIPNPFPELCSPAGSPVLSPLQTSDNHDLEEDKNFF